MDPSDHISEHELTEEGLPAASPDSCEEVFQDEIDNIIPTRGYQMTPMVGLGGSAGSIQALAKFFQAMPTDSGMVFVVILHLSPTHESTMADYLSRSTTMPVVQAEDGQKVEPEPRLRDPTRKVPDDRRRPSAACRLKEREGKAAWRSTCSSARSPTPTGRTRPRLCSRARMATARWGSSGSRSAVG